MHPCPRFAVLFAPIRLRRAFRVLGCAASARSHLTGGIAGLLATRKQLSEDVRILAVVVAELKLIQIQRQILLADVVVSADHATLEQRPERFDVVGMNEAAHVLALTVRNRLMRQALPAI